MVAGLLVLLGCQLLGTLIADVSGLPVPGPVLGLVLLLVWLELRTPADDSGLARVCGGLLRHLQLFFIPAGVGVVQYLGLVASAAFPLVVGLVASWVAALLVCVAVTGVLLLATERRAGGLRGAR